MQKFRVYFATKDHVPTRWFRSKKEVLETEYVVVSAHNEAHASKEAKKHVDLATLTIPFQVTHIERAPADEAEGCHGHLARTAPPQARAAVPEEDAPQAPVAGDATADADAPDGDDDRR
ncbi:hypothetical protein [Solidesulfovibrio sp.]|uniref:hypothetical protein n=1 Tax=Solidesulfovibrio sp. TaxID=2910990 RepID=UPI00263219B8|nr:hypothetical protein [Solidesulfovibrio sp.]